MCSACGLVKQQILFEWPEISMCDLKEMVKLGICVTKTDGQVFCQLPFSDIPVYLYEVTFPEGSPALAELQALPNG
jgi:hypothetical protein